MNDKDRRVIAIALLAFIQAFAYLASTFIDIELQKKELQKLANTLEAANQEVHAWGRPK